MTVVRLYNRRLSLSSKEGFHIKKVVKYTFKIIGLRHSNVADGYQSNIHTCSNYSGTSEICLSTVKAAITFVHYKILMIFGIQLFSI